MVNAATARLCAYRVRGRWALKIDSDCTISTRFVPEGYESPRITHRRWGAEAGPGRQDQEHLGLPWGALITSGYEGTGGP